MLLISTLVSITEKPPHISKKIILVRLCLIPADKTAKITQDKTKPKISTPIRKDTKS